MEDRDVYWRVIQGDLGCEQCSNWNGVKWQKPCKLVDGELDSQDPYKDGCSQKQFK